MQIYLSEADPNRKGDLFNERMKDLVHALGYEVQRVNISKPGRELDLIALHRLEGRKVVVECKAQVDTIGGGDINKFVGALDAETEDAVKPTGYYISVSGFKQSALEQEAATKRLRCVLMGPQQIHEQLVAGNILVSEQTVAHEVGRLRDPSSPPARISMDLVADEAGWLYVARLRDALTSEDFAFSITYASGRPLEAEPVEQLLLRAPALQVAIEGLQLLAPTAATGTPATAAALTAYQAYLQREFGVIRHEGMPTDAELGASRAMRLEELYVPLRLRRVADEESPTLPTPGTGATAGPSGSALTRVGEAETREIISLAEALRDQRHLSVLGPPGSGKTTLIKRLATAYPASLTEEPPEDLPDLNVLPVVLRCREVSAGMSIFDVLGEIPRLAEMPEHAEALMSLLRSELDKGGLLLLVDGLDEIADQGERLRFAQQLRTFLGRFPQNRLLVTCREAGFRLVAGSMAEFTARYRLQELSDNDVRALTRSWYQQAYGDSPKQLMAATALADSISSNWRLQRLAATPLLLTMLLLVQRWTGGQALPRKRSLLYRRSVDVLLNTWNTEAHRPLDLDEAVPQLAFLALEMTHRGLQRIAHSDALRILTAARQAMPDILGYTKSSPASFLSAVELRSSLLIHMGYAEGSTGPEPAYEFKHLMFQEYLAAVAVVEDFRPRTPLRPLEELLEPHITDANWAEVIVLTVVLAGRRGGDLLSWLHTKYEQALDEARSADNAKDEDGADRADRADHLLDLMEQCLSDESNSTPSLANDILHAVALRHSSEYPPYTFSALLDSRYSSELRSVLAEGLRGPSASAYSTLATAIFLADLPASQDLETELATLLAQEDAVPRRVALSVLSSLAYQLSDSVPDDDDGGFRFDQAAARRAIHKCLPPVVDLATSGDSVDVELALWVLCWARTTESLTAQFVERLLPRLVAAVLHEEHAAADHFAGWLMADLVLDMPSLSIGLSGDQAAALDAWLPSAPRFAHYQQRVRGLFAIATATDRISREDFEDKMRQRRLSQDEVTRALP